MDKRLERILPRVQKPARYTGGEYNQIIKALQSCGYIQEGYIPANSMLREFYC